MTKVKSLRRNASSPVYAPYRHGDDKENVPMGVALTSPAPQTPETRQVRRPFTDKSSLINSGSSGAASLRKSGSLKKDAPRAAKAFPQIEDLQLQLANAKKIGLRYHNALYGPIWKNEKVSIQRLVRKINELLVAKFDKSFNERINQIISPDTNFDSLVDLFETLEEAGFLFDCILEEFRAVDDIEAMALTKTFEAALVYNMPTVDLIPVFSKPNSWNALRELALENCSLVDLDLTYISRLSGLIGIALGKTGIGDEAVCHLVALQKVEFLDLSDNTRITDLSVNTLMHFKLLKKLALSGTSYTMNGLRVLCKPEWRVYNDIDEMLMIRIRKLYIRGLETLKHLEALIIPASCVEYLQERGRQYIPLQREGPPIDNDGQCYGVSVVDGKIVMNDFNFLFDSPVNFLKEQLSLHRRVNPYLNIGGIRSDIEERLRKLLMRRIEDEAIALMVTGTLKEIIRQRNAGGFVLVQGPSVIDTVLDDA